MKNNCELIFNELIEEINLFALDFNLNLDCQLKVYKLDNYLDKLEILNDYLLAYTDIYSEYIIKFSKKRKVEFLLGRLLAHQALLEVGCNHAFVGINKDRSPVWPHGFNGSISHCEDTIVCAVFKCNLNSRIGVDVENIINEYDTNTLYEYIANKNEMKLLQDEYSTQIDMNTLTAILSAKESLYKALYPELGFFFGFEAASLASINKIDNSFIIVLNKQLSPTLQIGKAFYGVVLFSSNTVLTFILNTL